MHYAGGCAIFRSNFVYLMFGAELLNFSKLSNEEVIKHTLPLEKSRNFSSLNFSLRT